MTLLHFIKNDSEAPRKGKDMTSLVCVVGDPKKYTKSEIDLLEEFAAAHKNWDDRLGTDKTGAFYVYFEKRIDGTWRREKESWAQGCFVSPTLEDALAKMYRAYNLPIPPSVFRKAAQPNRVLKTNHGLKGSLNA